MTGEAEVLLDWAHKKRDEEMQMESLAKEHPAVQIALDNLKKAKLQLDATIILSKEHDTSTS
jgi:multidrug resistance efflux pump